MWFEKNISIYDNLTGHLRFMTMLIKVLFMCSKAYSNFFTIFLSVMKSKYPVIGILKSGDKILLNNFYHVYFIAKAETAKVIQYNLDNNMVLVVDSPFLSGNIRFYGAIENGDIIGIFLDGVYEDLPIQNKIVVDVGANIGDSSVYFALKGAKKVIALEPFPQSYEMAKKNTEANNVPSKIELLLAGCSSVNKWCTIDPNLVSNIVSKITESNNGIKVPMMTLSQLVKDYNINEDSILKIDCEGCEYDILLSTSTEMLQKFSHIFLEYHYGYKNLKEKLEESGFTVSITRPSISGQIPTILHLLRKFAIKIGIKASLTSINSNTSSSYFGDNSQHRLTCFGQIHAIQKMRTID